MSHVNVKRQFIERVVATRNASSSSSSHNEDQHRASSPEAIGYTSISIISISLLVTGNMATSHTWLHAIEADMRPLNINIGLSSAYRRKQLFVRTGDSLRTRRRLGRVLYAMREIERLTLLIH